VESLDRLIAATPEWEGPHPYRSLRARLRLQSEWVDRGARPVTLGATRGGRDLFAFRIGPSTGVATVLMAGIHALEWIGVEVLERLVAEILAQGTDREIIVVPIVNLDGFALVDDDLRTGRRAIRRATPSGVDLNRNWPTFHASATSLVTRFLPGIGGTGSGPASEPEVAGILRLLDAVVDEGRTIDRALSLHSFGRMILVPWGGRLGRPDAALFAAARAIQSAIPLWYGVRQISWWLPGHRVPGMEVDHLHARYGAVALLVECSLGGISPFRLGSWLHPFRWYNPPDPSREIEALAPALRQFVTASH
jgi:hypothetical protein